MEQKLQLLSDSATSEEVFKFTAMDCFVVQLLVSTHPAATPPGDSAGGASEGVTGVGAGASPGTGPGGGMGTASIEMVNLSDSC